MEAVETGSANLHLTGRCQPMKPPQTAANHGLRNVLNKWYFPRDTPNQLHLTPQDSRPRTRPRKHISTYFGSGGGIERRGPFFPSPFASRLVDDPLTPPPLYYYSPPFIHSRNKSVPSFRIGTPDRLVPILCRRFTVMEYPISASHLHLGWETGRRGNDASTGPGSGRRPPVEATRAPPPSGEGVGYTGVGVSSCL